MPYVNRETVTALVLMLVTGVAYVQTFKIQVRDDGVMRATVWPTAIIVLLAILSVIYLVQSLKAAPASRAVGTTTGEAGPATGMRGWLAYYANPLWCFALYFAFLATLPWLGMLIGGTLLVFSLLTVLGGFSVRKIATHALIAIASIGSMWAIFTYLLRVILPEGEILPLIIPR